MYFVFSSGQRHYKWADLCIFLGYMPARMVKCNRGDRWKRTLKRTQFCIRQQSGYSGKMRHTWNTNIFYLKCISSPKAFHWITVLLFPCMKNNCNVWTTVKRQPENQDWLRQTGDACARSSRRCPVFLRTSVFRWWAQDVWFRIKVILNIFCSNFNDNTTLNLVLISTFLLEV